MVFTLNFFFNSLCYFSKCRVLLYAGTSIVLRMTMLWSEPVCDLCLVFFFRDEAVACVP